MTLEFYKADGTTSTSTVSLKLYENNAPKTVAHIKKLIKDGYYNGVCVNNVDPYFIELGEYCYEGDTLTKKSDGIETVRGEFDANGVVGQRENINAGAIVLKRDRGTGTLNYNSGTCGLYFMTMGHTDITEDDYCFIGRVVEEEDKDDGSTSAVDTTTNIDDVDRSDYTSFRIIKSINDFREKKEESKKTILYYNSKTRVYYRYEEDINNGYKTVYKLSDSGETKLSDLEQTEFLDVFKQTGSGYADEYYDYFKIPYQKIIVKQMKLV